MKKKITLISIILTLVLALSLCVGLTASFYGKKKAKKGSDQTVTVCTDYKIKYVAIQNGAETNIRSILWKKNGNYPQGYNHSEETVIDDLLGKMTLVEDGALAGVYYGEPVLDPSNPYKDYSFFGWYLDKNCTEAFDGVIAKHTVGDITLYAKISVGYWSENY